MRIVALVALAVFLAMVVYGCATTDYAAGNGGFKAGIDKLDEAHGFDHALWHTDRFDRMMESPDWLDAHYRWPHRRFPR